MLQSSAATGGAGRPVGAVPMDAAERRFRPDAAGAPYLRDVVSGAYRPFTTYTPPPPPRVSADSLEPRVMQPLPGVMGDAAGRTFSVEPSGMIRNRLTGAAAFYGDGAGSPWFDPSFGVPQGWFMPDEVTRSAAAARGNMGDAFGRMGGAPVGAPQFPGFPMPDRLDVGLPKLNPMLADALLRRYLSDAMGYTTDRLTGAARYSGPTPGPYSPMAGIPQDTWFFPNAGTAASNAPGAYVPPPAPRVPRGAY